MDRGWRGQNSGKEFNIQRLNEARSILAFAGDLIKCYLPRRQMKRLARYLEKIQLNNIDVVEGDAILIGMRKEASKTVNRLLQKLEGQLQQPSAQDTLAGTGVQSSYYCVGVCVGYTETVVTLLVDGRAPYTTVGAMGLFVPSAASCKSDRRHQQAGSGVTPSLPQNPLIHVMQSVFEQLLGFLECGLIPELPVQVPNAGDLLDSSAGAAGRYPLNTEVVVLSSCSPSPMASRLLLVRAWNEMVKAMVPSIAHLMPRPDNEVGAGGLDGLNSPGRHGHGEGDGEGWGEPQMSSERGGRRGDKQQAPLSTLSGVKVVHSHAAAAALLAAYFSSDSYALFKASPMPFQRLPMDGRGAESQVEADAEVEIDFSAECDDGDVAPPTTTSCSSAGADATATATATATSTSTVSDGSGVEDGRGLEIRCTETVLHVVASIEDMILYVSVLLVSTEWSRPATGPGLYKARGSSVRWLHHSRHCYKPLFVAKTDPRSGRANQLASKEEVARFLGSVWDLHVLRMPVPADNNSNNSNNSSNSSNNNAPCGSEAEDPLVDVHGYMQHYPVRGVHLVGRECSVYARRHGRQEVLLCAPRAEGAADGVSASPELHLLMPYERVVEVTDETKSINNYHNNVRSGVFDRPKSEVYSDAQKQRHSFLRQVEEFFRHCTLHSDEERATTRAVALAVTDAAGRVSDSTAASALLAKCRSMLVPTANHMLPVLLSFELSGVQNEALGAALFGAGCLLAHSEVGAAGSGRDRGGLARLNLPPRSLQQQLEDMPKPPRPSAGPGAVAEERAATAAVLPPAPAPTAAATAAVEPADIPAPNPSMVGDVSGYTIGIRSTSRQSSPHDSGCGAGSDSLFNQGCGLSARAAAAPAVPLLFMPFVTASMQLPATATHELHLTDCAAGPSLDSAAYPTSYQLDIMVSSNINKYFCRPCQFARVSIEDSDREQGCGSEAGNATGIEGEGGTDSSRSIPVVLVVTLSLNERRELYLTVARRQTTGPAMVLLKRQRLAYTPQVAQLRDHWLHWTCPAQAARYKELGNAAMKAASAKREDTEGAAGEALSAQEEEARRQVWVQRRHRQLQLALLFYSEGLRFEPCNHLLLSNRCAVLSHLESSGGNALSNRALVGANCDHRGRPVAAWFVNKATLYLATTYLFSALFDAKECIRHSNFAFSKGFIRLGAIYYQLKKYHNALALYRYGLHLDPTNRTITASIIDTQEKIVALEGSSPGEEPVNYVKSLADRFKELHSQKDRKNKAKNKEQQSARKQFKISMV